MRKSRNYSKSKTRSKTRNKTRNKTRSIISKYKEKINQNEKNIILNNLLVNPKNINKTQNEIMFHSGIILRNVGDILYFKYDPLSVTSVDLCNKMLYLFSPCLTTVLNKTLYNNKSVERIIKKRFNRFMTFIDLKNDLGGDVTFQMKLLRYLLNENVLDNFKNIKNKNKIIIYLDELIELRNNIAHLTYKKEDYKIKQLYKSKKRSNYYKLNKLRNFNYIKDHLTKIIYIIESLYEIRNDIGKKINVRIFKRNYISLLNIKVLLDDLCLIIERRKRMTKKINTHDKNKEIAQETLNFLQNKLNSTNKKTSETAARNINNLVSVRIRNDSILKKHLGKSLSNKECKKYCSDI